MGHFQQLCDKLPEGIHVPFLAEAKSIEISWNRRHTPFIQIIPIYLNRGYIYIYLLYVHQYIVLQGFTSIHVYTVSLKYVHIYIYVYKYR